MLSPSIDLKIMVCSLDGIGSNFMALAYILVDSDDLMVAALISVGLVCVRLLYSVVRLNVGTLRILICLRMFC